MDFEKMNEEEALKVTYHCEMAQLQDKISQLRSSNNKRVNIFNNIVIALFTSIAILILHITSIILFK